MPCGEGENTNQRRSSSTNAKQYCFPFTSNCNVISPWVYHKFQKLGHGSPDVHGSDPRLSVLIRGPLPNQTAADKSVRATPCQNQPRTRVSAPHLAKTGRGQECPRHTVTACLR